jgi:hypothetical protein
MFAPPKQLFDEITDFLSSAPDTDALLAFTPSHALVDRLDELLEQNKTTGLSQEERAELDEFLRMNHLLKMVRLKAKLRVQGGQ